MLSGYKARVNRASLFPFPVIYEHFCGAMTEVVAAYKKQRIMKQLTNIIVVLLVMIAISTPFAALAQGPGFGGSVDDGGVCVPLDGGLSMLIAAGAGIGIKKLADKRKARATEK